MDKQVISYHPQCRPLQTAGRTRFVVGFLLPVFALLFLLLFPAAPLQAAEEDISDSVLEKRYRIAKIYYHNLQHYYKLGKSHPRWDKAVRAFRQIYLARPKDDIGMNSLFMMGRLYYDKYIRFHNPLDLDEAIAYYDDVTLLFPNGLLPDHLPIPEQRYGKSRR
jgi:tetratricopeptide (TPR) repeat protein